VSIEEHHPGNESYRDFYDWTATCAGQTVAHLEEAWERPVRHNLKIERAALWWAHITIEQIADVFSRPDQLWMLNPQGVDAPTRYDLQASLRTIPTVMPPDGLGWNHKQLVGRVSETPLGLQREMDLEFEFKGERGERARKRAPDVFREWHEWLWTRDTRGRRTRAEPSQQAAVLAEGCTRLALSLNTIIGTYQRPRPA
jgi:hypothetical protein